MIPEYHFISIKRTLKRRGGMGGRGKTIGWDDGESLASDNTGEVVSDLYNCQRDW